MEGDSTYQTATKEFDSKVPAPEPMHRMAQNEPRFSEELLVDQAKPIEHNTVQVSPETFDLLMQAVDQVDSSTTFELITLQNKIKLLENQNNSLLQTNAMYSQQNTELINKCQELENRNENLSQELTVLNQEFEEFKVQFAKLK